jgi:glycosyltransferase involved in cell wall biosynthesis
MSAQLGSSPDVSSNFLGSKPLFQEYISDIIAVSAQPISGIEQLVGENSAVSHGEASEVFLSVLLRSQGKRSAALRDALLCLSAQTDQNFEVLLLVHDASDEGSAMIRSTLARYSDEFRAKVRVLPVSGESRSRPLNVGLAEARGQYFAAFDDDDLLFAHWVEEFHAASRRAPGRVLRSVAAIQDVSMERWASGEQGFRSGSWPMAEYATTFKPLEHLLVNHSPFMTVAFPLYLFRVYGMCFDEQLDVCEDWDYILRSSLFTGVESIEVITAIYRRWTGAETSYTRHNVKAWEASERRVVDKLNARGLLLPPGAVNDIRELILIRDIGTNYAFLFNNGIMRKPFSIAIKIVSPFIRLSVRARNIIRRGFGRAIQSDDTQ